MTRPEKTTSLEEAVATIEPGSIVAIGGHTLEKASDGPRQGAGPPKASATST